MDTSRTRGASPAQTSRLPTKRNSFQSLRDMKDFSDRRPPPSPSPALTTSPGAVSDTSSGTGADNGFGGVGSGGVGHFGFDSRRSSTSSQQSDLVRGRSSTGNPGQTRIPRPSPSQRPPSQQAAHTPLGPQTSARRPLPMMDAYRMAVEKEAAAEAKAAQGSPSPAPRPWRDRNGKSSPATTPTSAPGESGRATPASASESRMQKILSQSPLDVGGRRTARRIGEPILGRDMPARAQRRSIGGAGDDGAQIASNGTTARPDRGNNTDLRRIRYEEDQARMQVAMGEKPGGLFSPKARVSPKIAVAGRELHRRTSTTSLSDKSKVPASPTSTRTATGTRSSMSNRTVSSLSNRTGSSLSNGTSRPGSYLKRMMSAPEPAAAQAPAVSSTKLSNGADSPPPAAPLESRSASARNSLPTQTEEALVEESPGKSFAWNADEDFTASDLMTSESPRVELRSDTSTPPPKSPTKLPSKSPLPRPRNTKLEEIRQLELDADLIFPDDSPTEDRHADSDDTLSGPVIATANGKADSEEKFEEKPESEEANGQKDDNLQPQRLSSLPAERTNKTLDEIRMREDAPPPKGAMAAIKLEEIRQQNAESRAQFIDTARKLSHEHLRAEMARTAKASTGEEPNKQKLESKEELAARAARDRALFGEEMEQIPNTPITIFRTSSAERGRKLLSTDGGGSDGETAKNTSVSPAASSKSSSSTHSRKESQELLKKLARVSTSVVAAAERKDNPRKLSASPNRLAERFSGDNLRVGFGTSSIDAILEKSVSVKFLRARDSDTLRPTVGFAQLRRQPSSESGSTKRSSLAQSDGDPTDRIEAEMKLFAAGENHSERGSIRAPSPYDDLDDADNGRSGTSSGDKSSGLADEATPKPAKTVNPLMQPTPRVTGAYVETPVTARADKLLEVIHEPPVASHDTATAADVAVASGTTEKATANGDNNGPASTSSSRQKSHSHSRSRSRSRSRGRVPPINSAKPASARDDLLAIQRDQQIDDSTLDDFEELLATHTAAAGAVEAGPGKGPLGDATTDSAQLRRMSQSIATYLHDVKSFKKGIERLEDQVSHPEKSAAALAELEREMAEAENTQKVEVTEKDEKPAVTNGPIALIKSEPDGDTSPGLSDMALIPAKQTKPQHKRQASLPTSEKDAIKNEKADSASAPLPATSVPLSSTPTISYVQIPLPRLYRVQPDVKLTYLGILLLLLSIWFAAESTTCAFFCRPSTCQSGQACQWSPDDPSFGAAVPVKLDQWLTGGRGRHLVAWAGEEFGDWVADTWDTANGIDIRQVDSTYFSFDEKRRHRRRLQKRGLLPVWTPSPEARPQLEAWRRAREARDRERRAREELAYGYAGGMSSSRYPPTEQVGHGETIVEEDDDDGFEDVVRPSSEHMVADEKVGSWW
ncbi:hypothetical protein SEPCBS119000_002954 [Sporothrix epigloea]|uniref:Uncharacterized protein n=1 Tax=Sporothrix epigloea TaxID=1892477 RepID=A0ABP0DJ09_9PEZI